MQNNGTRKRITKNNSSLNPRKRNQSRSTQTNPQLVIFKEPGRFAPNRMIVDLVWNDTTFTRNVTSSNAMNWAIRSSAYDPDPASLTGSIPGFVELANLYSLYRVKKMKLDLEVSNQGTEACIVAAWPSNVIQNTNSLTQADILEYSGNVHASTALVSSVNGASKTRLRVVASGEQLVGPNYNTDLDYAASTSSNPTEMYGINIGIVNLYGNFAYAMATKAKYVYTVEFFRLRQLES